MKAAAGRVIMTGSEFVYFSMRSRKQRQMAETAITKRAVQAHLSLANAYADRAALAMIANG
jgi:hypothetical protein